MNNIRDIRHALIMRQAERTKERLQRAMSRTHRKFSGCVVSSELFEELSDRYTRIFDHAVKLGWLQTGTAERMLADILNPS